MLETLDPGVLTFLALAGLAAGSNWIWNFLLAFFTPFITNAIHFRYGFIFAACNLAGAVIVYFFLYESSDLSLENIDLMYNDPNCKPWHSTRWAPPGFSNRAEMIQARTDQNGEHGNGDRKSPIGVEEGREEKASWSHDGHAPQDGAVTGTGEKAAANV